MEAGINNIVIEHFTKDAQIVTGIYFRQALDHLYDRSTVREKLFMFL